MSRLRRYAGAMTTQQLILSLVLATMVFSVAIDLRLDDFRRVAAMPRAVVGGLVPQFVLLPVATWLVTVVLDLPPSTEAAMMLVAACPGGALSNYVTHLGRGNTALSVSISALSSVLALVLTPFNFTWMVSTNAATADWLRQLSIDPTDILWSLLALLAVPMALGLWIGQRWPASAVRLRKPLSRFSLFALGAFIVGALIQQRQLLGGLIVPQFVIVVLHNALGLALGAAGAWAFRLGRADARAVIIEGGMQNSGLALGIIGAQFGGDIGMVIVASLWGMWHIVSGLSLAIHWRQGDARSVA
jgi:BASS family bile acid:Na+ symporter